MSRAFANINFYTAVLMPNHSFNGLPMVPLSDVKTIARQVGKNVAQCNIHDHAIPILEKIVARQVQNKLHACIV